MREINLIDRKTQSHGQQKLKEYYRDSLIPPEKKEYLTNLKESVGPYMGIESENGETTFLFDAASQIATLGLGFNPASFFGTSHFIEAWLNNPDTQNAKNIIQAFKNFLQRKSNFENLELFIANSGAEANEIALGFCYKKRRFKEAKRVLSFEGSFHGRMMVSLASTWNKVKREPFEWEGYQSVYCPYPELEDDKINLQIPTKWFSSWDQSPNKNWVKPNSENDPTLKLEIDCLEIVREKLLGKEIFAIIIEPMQCEGGDRYSSNRFHLALLAMAKSFQIPIVYDEVQTGFHLGREFFWHKHFDLRDDQGREVSPDYLICAKKSQVGLVLANNPNDKQNNHNEFSMASLIRGYIHGLSLDQNQKSIINLENKVRPRLQKLLQKFSKNICRPRLKGIAFAFDVVNQDDIARLVKARFDYGLLYYPAGSKTLRFRLNISVKENDLDILFEQLEDICASVFLGKNPEIISLKKTTSSRGVQKLYDWHLNILKNQLKSSQEKNISEESILAEMTNHFSHHHQLDFIIINADNFSKYKESIIKIEEAVYEPARRTDIQSFEKIANEKNGIAIGLLKNEKLLGITFTSPLKNHPKEKMVREDLYFNDSSALYMLDLTLSKELRGKGLGQDLKYALSLIALSKGVTRIHGRNRDRLASSMLDINLSLGSYESKYRKEDYLDDEDYRDVIYYSTPLKWERPQLSLSDAIRSPLGISSLDVDYFEERLPYIVNKVCLSNFVGHNFLNYLKELLQTLPKELQHGYTTSGQSECVDKLVKSYWFKNKDKHKDFKQISFKGHYFGEGSFLSRSLSEDDDQYFPVTKLDSPNQKNISSVLQNLETLLKTGEYFSVWIEPLLQKTMERIEEEYLKEIKALCEKYSIPLFYNETASSAFRYSQDLPFASNIESIRPSGGIAYLGGQAGIVFTEQKHFIEKPLMLISTWDGDEFSFANYLRGFKNISDHHSQYKKVVNSFEKKISDILSNYHLDSLSITNGMGSFSGIIPDSLASFFKEISKGHYLIAPTFDDMNKFITEKL